MADLVALEEPLLEEALQRRLDGMRDAAALAEREVHGRRLAIPTGPSVVHDGGLELTQERRTYRGRFHRRNVCREKPTVNRS